MKKYMLHKHCVQCERLFCANDMIFYTDNGYGQYICQQCSERENMLNIKITAEVNGKRVPLETVSTETFAAIKALEKSKEIPVARVGNYHGEPRLFLTLNDKLKKCIAEDYVHTVAINLKTGNPTNDWSEERERLPDMYGEITIL